MSSVLLYLYSHSQLVTGAQKNLLTGTPWWWLQPMSPSSWGGRGALALQWVVKAQLASGAGRPLLLERTPPRTQG